MRLKADIRKQIGNFTLDVSIESDAKRIGILGASGSGKSMTLRSIAGIESVDSGHIEIDGRVLYDSESRTDLRPQKRNVGYMFQNYALFPTMSVLENVMAGLRGNKIENRQKARAMLDRFRLSGYEDRLPGELSGGQQQRVALARIMVTEPDLILLDEPFSALDMYLKDRMQLEMLEMLESYPGQIVMVSHSRDELYRFSDELFVIRQGSVLRHGATREVFRNPGQIEVAKLTGCKNFSDVRMIDPHTMELTGWGITLHLESAVPMSTGHIGYRAHYFEPVWGDREENCIPFNLVRVDELPFERNYYIRPEGEGASLGTVLSDRAGSDLPDQNGRPSGPVGSDRPDRNGRPSGPVGSDLPDQNGRPSGQAIPDQDGLICWFVQGEEKKILEQRGLPDYLKVREDQLLILE